MPLVRYELRSEYELANRELYRSAPKNDPEAILEGVSMVSLVGIVRQLGDLAEFAADVFHELHEAVMATAARSHDLMARVSQLEAELPAMEKAVLARKTNPVQLAYVPGLEWHASIRSDQNLCTQGDLPRFIRSSYEECRGPPRLFLLDKFDVGGAGACLKRYTDPSFFKMEWASSEIMKAEKAQQDKKARRSKLSRKPRRRKEGDAKDSSWPPPVQIQQQRPRYSTPVSVSSLDGLSETTTTPLANMVLDNEQANKPFPFVTFLGGSQTSSRESGVLLTKSVRRSDSAAVAAAAKETQEQVARGSPIAKDEKADDGASETEQFLDAMTTMESETDSEPQSKRRLLSLARPKTEKANDEAARFEDARTAGVDSETEAESKYSVDLTPITVPVHHDQGIHLQYGGRNAPTEAAAANEHQIPNDPEDLRLEYEDRDVTDDEGEYPEKDLPPEEYDDFRLEYPEEDDDLRTESRNGDANEDLSLEYERRELLEFHEGARLPEEEREPASLHEAGSRDVNEVGVIPDEAAALYSDRDYVEESPDEDGAGPESMRILEAEGIVADAKIASEAEDEEGFDVEGIQVMGDNADAKNEVQFEALLASDDEATVPAETPVIDDEAKGDGVVESRELELDEAELRVHQTAKASDPVLDIERSDVGVSGEESRNLPVADDGSETPKAESGEASSGVAAAAHEFRVPDPAQGVDEQEEHIIDEPEQHIIGLENVHAKAETLERNGSMQTSSPVEVFESASSHENFFTEESSSRFSAFSEENNIRNEELEVEEVFSVHDGYSGDDDSVGNVRSEKAASLLHWTSARESEIPEEDQQQQQETMGEVQQQQQETMGEVQQEQQETMGEVQQEQQETMGEVQQEQQETMQDREEEHRHEVPEFFSKRAEVPSEDGESSDKQQNDFRSLSDHKVVQEEFQRDIDMVVQEESQRDIGIVVQEESQRDGLIDKKNHAEAQRSESNDEKELHPDRQADAQEMEERQLHIDTVFPTDRHHHQQQESESEHPPSQQDLDALKRDAAWGPIYDFSDKSASSSPRSPIFSALRSPMSPARSTDGIEECEVGAMLAPSSPTFPSVSPPVPDEMPPLPPLPPLRWRTLFNPFQQESPSMMEVGDGLGSAAREPLTGVVQPREVSPVDAIKPAELLEPQGSVQQAENSLPPSKPLENMMFSQPLREPSPSLITAEDVPESLDVDTAERHRNLNAPSLSDIDVSSEGPAATVAAAAAAAADIPTSTMDEAFSDAEVEPPPAKKPRDPETSAPVADAAPTSLVDDSQPSSLAAKDSSSSHADEQTPPVSTTVRDLSVSPPADDDADADDDDNRLPTTAPAKEDLSHLLDSQPLPASTMEEVSMSPPPSPRKEQLPDPVPAAETDILPPQSYPPATATDESPEVSSPKTAETADESVPPCSPSPAKDLSDESSSPTQGDHSTLELGPSPPSQAKSPIDTEAFITPPASPLDHKLEQSPSEPQQEFVLHPAAEGTVDPSEASSESAPSRLVDDSSLAAPDPTPERNLDEDQAGTVPASPVPAKKDPPDDALIQAISVHDRSKLKRVPSDPPAVPKAPHEREVLLEQIRSQSFNLRHTIVEKKEIKEATPRLVTNINVAAILEKANAIRQSLADSEDEDDDWSE